MIRDRRRRPRHPRRRPRPASPSRPPRRSSPPRSPTALKLRVTAPAAGKLTATAKGASGSATAKRAGATSLTLRFTKAARRAARHKHTLKLSITVRQGSADGLLVVMLKR